jgi:hypothetical protein
LKSQCFQGFFFFKTEKSMQPDFKKRKLNAAFQSLDVKPKGKWKLAAKKSAKTQEKQEIAEQLREDERHYDYEAEVEADNASYCYTTGFCWKCYPITGCEETEPKEGV